MNISESKDSAHNVCEKLEVMGKTILNTSLFRCHPAWHSSWLNCFSGHMVAIQATGWQILKQPQICRLTVSRNPQSLSSMKSFVFCQLRSAILLENGIGRGLKKEMKQAQKSKQKCNSQHQCCRSTSPIQKGQTHSCCSCCNMVDASAQRLQWRDKW